MRTNNYTDKLTLLLKKDKAENIISAYQKFKWEVISKEENKRYEDIIDVSFSRPHKIDNKDDLQLLQVYMEDRINNLAKLEKNKFAKTTAFALFFGVAGLILLVLGILSCFNVLSILNTFGEIALIVLGSIFILIEIIFVRKISSKEKLEYLEKSSKINNELDMIFQNVKALTGDKNEQDK